ncbi:PDR/VanB family oxidoreductase [Arthrobacter sp.]|uniref:PDR/VanB family oxidoreductase n=1 Tax=Arthrobacter sp. TaxID=1667 RepID=UPI003A8F000F
MAVNSTAVWQDGVVIEAHDVAEGIRRIVIEPELPVNAEPGSHLDLTVPIQGEPVTRSYSIVESLEGGRRLAISVLRAPASRGGSIHLHTLQPGAPLRITQPLQNFPLRIGAPRYVLLAGGIGITAIAHMARVLKSIKADYRLVYAGRRRDAMAYLSDLEAEHGDRISVHVDAEGTALKVPELIASLDAGTELYMCGPIRLMDAVRRGWNDAGFDAPSLRYETFGNSGWYDPEEFTVRIPRLGVETKVGAGSSLLEALEEAGVEMMFDCRKGECGLCQVKILDLDGTVDHRDVFYSQRQQDASSQMCVCVSRVARPADAENAADAGADPQCGHHRPAVVSIDVG